MIGGMSVRLTIMSVIEQVADEHKRTLGLLTDDLRLFESGLDSLSLAVMVLRLEEKLMVDPFTGSTAGDFPETLGGLVATYERAAKSHHAAESAASHENADPF
jgi:hypothetical protein